MKVWALGSELVMADFGDLIQEKSTNPKIYLEFARQSYSGC